MKDRFTKIVELIHKMKRNRRGKLEMEIAQIADEVHDTAKMFVDSF